MQKFELVLKNEKIKVYRLITLFIFLLHILFFIYLLFNHRLWKTGIYGLIFFAAYIIYRSIVSKISGKKIHLTQHYFFVFFLLFSIPWLVILDIILFILSTIALQKIIFDVDPSMIKQQKFPWKKWEWKQLDNVILKDKILTLDFKNNKIMQAEIEEDPSLSERDFNTFAQKQLNISTKKNPVE